MERSKGSNWCYHLAGLVLLTTWAELSFKCSCFHNLDKFDQLWLCFVSYDVMRFTEIWCDEWDFELHWAKLNIKLRLNSPSKSLCLVYKFEILCSMFIDFFRGSQLDLHENICTYHLNFFKKEKSNHFGLFWYIHVCQELTQQMIKKPRNHP